jgi:hypothetical protein
MFIACTIRFCKDGILAILKIAKNTYLYSFYKWDEFEEKWTERHFITQLFEYNLPKWELYWKITVGFVVGMTIAYYDTAVNRKTINPKTTSTVDYVKHEVCLAGQECHPIMEGCENTALNRLKPIKLSQSDKYWLILNTKFEAGNQPDQGKIKVIQVTLNRCMERGGCYNKVEATVKEKKQFSWIAEKHKIPQKINNETKHILELINLVASGMVLNEGEKYYYNPAIAKGNFHSNLTTRGWESATINNHTFFKKGC